MLCHNGHDVPDDAAFCPLCGTNAFRPVSAGYAGFSPVRPTNGLAIASLVLGIVWVYWVGSILALIFGFIARKQIKEHHQSGDGMAIAGIVLGFVGIATLVVFLIVVVAIGHAASPSY